MLAFPTRKSIGIWGIIPLRLEVPHPRLPRLYVVGGSTSVGTFKILPSLKNKGQLQAAEVSGMNADLSVVSGILGNAEGAQLWPRLDSPRGPSSDRPIWTLPDGLISCGQPSQLQRGIPTQSVD